MWREAANELTVFAINRANEVMEFTAELAGFEAEEIIEAKEIHNSDLDATNTPNQENVSSQAMNSDRYTLANNVLEAKLKPYSWNMFRVKLGK